MAPPSGQPSGQPAGYAPDIQQTLDLALRHLGAGELSEAEGICQQLLKTDPNQPVALHLLGVIAHQEGKNDIAVDLITSALAIKPDYADAHYNLGNMLIKLERLDEAVASYRKALTIKPDWADAHYNLGNAFLELERLDEAVASYNKALVIKPDWAQVHYNLGNAFQELGKLDEAVASYRKALAIKPDYADAHSNLGNTLKQRGRLDEAVECYNKALVIKPDWAEAHSNLGNAFQKLERLDEAMESYNKALAIKPDSAEVHYNLGNMLKQLDRLDEAVASYHKALVIKPDFTQAHSNLGNAFQKLRKLDEAVASYRKALVIEPDCAQAHSNLGNALQELGKLDEAVESYHKALVIEPDNADAHYNLGMAQLLMGNFRNGWENYNFRWLCDTFAPSYQQYDKPLWQGDAIDGSCLLVWKEQGVGESIIFASMIPDLIERGADVILECDKRLVALFSRSFPAITCAAADDTDSGKTQDKNKKFDLHAPLGNAGRWLRADLASFPARPSYLVADGERRDTLRNRYLEKGNDFLVGISWHSKGSNYGEQKSMTLPDLRPLLETPGITFIDLQYGDTAKERTAFTAETGIEVYHDNGVDQMADLDIFASQVAAMDMVVTISNTTAHMAGALGVPTLLMLGSVPIWYWLLGYDNSPWYPSLRLLRQHKSCGWQEVVERTRNELSARAGDG